MVRSAAWAPGKGGGCRGEVREPGALLMPSQESCCGSGGVSSDCPSVLIYMLSRPCVVSWAPGSLAVHRAPAIARSAEPAGHQRETGRERHERSLFCPPFLPPAGPPGAFLAHTWET